MSRKAAGTWHPSRETKTGPFGATISENRKENRIHRSAVTQVSIPRSWDRFFFTMYSVVDVGEAAVFNHPR